VEKLAKHPNADKLQLATVDYGAGAPKTVVTGATNLTEGAIVPYADEGATIIDGHTGERATLRGKPMRGIKSEGMVLSRKELGLGDDHEGVHILDAKLPVGAILREVLGETILALELPPNRPDCLGVTALAREVAALLGTDLRAPPRDRLGTAAPRGLAVAAGRRRNSACTARPGARPHAGARGSSRRTSFRSRSRAPVGSFASTRAPRSRASRIATRSRARGSTSGCVSLTCRASWGST